MEDLTTFLAQVDIAASDDGKLPDEVFLLKAGTWNTPRHGKIQLDEKKIDHYVSNFNELHAGVYDLPMNYDHNRNLAGGWMSSLFRKGSGKDAELWAKAGWTPSAKRHLTEKGYRYLSPEFWPKGWVNPLNASDIRDDVLVGCALVNKPLFKGVLKEVLQPVAASEDNNNKIYIKGETMDLATVRVKKYEELTDEEKKYVQEHKAELNDEERKRFQLEEKSTPPSNDPPKDPPADPPKDPQDPPKTDPTKANDGVMITAAEYSELQAKAQKGVEASEKLTRNEMQAKVDAAVSRGAIKSEQAGKTVDMLVAASDSDRTGWLDHIAKLPDNAILAGEIGSGSSGSQAASDELANRAAGVVKESGGKTNYGDAVKGILASDSGLRDRYNAERENE